MGAAQRSKAAPRLARAGKSVAPPANVRRRGARQDGRMTPRPLLALLAVAGCIDPAEPGALVTPTVDDDPALPALEVNGTRLHVTRVGTPTRGVVVFLHGGPGNDHRYMLDLTVAHDGIDLADDHELVLFDQRGSGRSRRHDRVDIADYDRDLEALIDAVSPDAPVVLVGHSWGGLHAARYLAAHPDRVRGAVFLNSMPFSRALLDERPSPYHPDLLGEGLNDWIWSAQLVSPDDHARADYYIASLSHTRLPAYGNHEYAPNWRFGAVVYRDLNLGWTEDFDHTAALGAFAAPVLVIGGGDDQILGAEFSAVQAELFADAELVVIDGAGHNDVLLGKAGESVAAIDAYLERLP
jgi:proline iminopeptidase